MHPSHGVSFKVKLYTKQTCRNEAKAKIISLFSEKGIKLNKITLPNENLEIILAYTANTKDAQKIFDEDIVSALKSMGITAIEPAKLKIKKNIFIKRVMQPIFQEEEDWISSQIEINNEVLVVNNVIKMKKSNTLKIEFKPVYRLHLLTS